MVNWLVGQWYELQMFVINQLPVSDLDLSGLRVIRDYLAFFYFLFDPDSVTELVGWLIQAQGTLWGRSFLMRIKNQQ